MEKGKMQSLGIIHVRLDERMIHGQVATLWSGNLGATRIMIADDAVAKNEIEKASLKTAVPGGVKLSILKVETAAARIQAGNYIGQKVFLIVPKLSDLFELIDAGVPIEAFNLGNLSLKPGIEGVRITKSCYLTQDQLDRCLALEKEGIRITAQMVPMEQARPLSQLLKK
ncbi:MAG: PTS sugar transporter subunit IIB [Streptococcaceae bacterium]|jgi:PTS system mannose-specific IIB component|nr:PTS sugar transporter subunit IIB [Streptococcaceae bacterium]